MTVKKPLLLFASFSGEGHFYPVMSIAKHMMKNGHDVAFVVQNTLKEKVEEAGMEYIETHNIITKERMQKMQAIAGMPPGIERLSRQLEEVFFETLPGRVERFQQILEEVKARDPAREIIIIEDVFNMVVFPYKYGRPLPKGFDKLPQTVGVGCAPLMLESEDVGPMLFALPPDPTESGKMRNRALHQLVKQGPMKVLIDSWASAMRECECTRIPDIKVWNTGYDVYDIVFQMCSASVEYPMSDLPSSIKYAGVLPRRQPGSNYQYPQWWSEVTGRKTNGRNRQVIFVSQGTVSRDYGELIIPTLRAFAGHDDVLVIAALGNRDATLPEGTEVPGNARVIDYLPYDLILELSDVFITNGGYGSFMHSISNGCPVVVAGDSEEKIEVATRVVYSGIGVSLGTQKPSTKQVAEGVEKVLGDSKYKQRAIELRKENEDLDALGTVRKGIEALLA